MSISYAYCEVDLGTDCKNDVVKTELSTCVALSPTPINYGETRSGTLSTPTEEDQFTFSGNAGDVIFLMLTGHTIAFDAELELLDPSSNSIGLAQSVTEAILRITLPTSGTYTSLVRELGQGDTGPYSLHLQKLNGPVGGAAINYGQTLNYEINPSGDADIFTFSGNAGDEIRIRITPLSGNIDPVAELYDAAGNLLAFDHTYLQSEIVFTLPATGTYHTQTYEVNAGDTGNFSVSLELLSTPDLAYGETKLSSLSTPTEEDQITFFGSAGDVIFLMLTGATIAFDAELELLDPNNNSIGFVQNVTEAILRLTLPEDGVYTSLVREWGQGDAGPYGLHLQRLNGPVGSPSMTYGRTRVREIAPYGDADIFTFSGNAGDEIRIRVTPLSGNIDPVAELYDAAGNLLAFDHTYLQSEIIFTLPATGTYHTQTYEVNAGDTGSFSISLDLLSNNNLVGMIDRNVLQGESILRVFPNPGSNRLNVEFYLLEEDAVELSITSMTGQLMQRFGKSRQFSSGYNRTTYDLSSLAPGVYVLTLRTKSQTLTSKIVKK